MKINFPASETKVSSAGNKSFPYMKLKQDNCRMKEKACRMVGKSAIYLYLCPYIIIN